MDDPTRAHKLLAANREWSTLVCADMLNPLLCYWHEQELNL